MRYFGSVVCQYLWSRLTGHGVGGACVALRGCRLVRCLRTVGVCCSPVVLSGRYSDVRPDLKTLSGGEFDWGGTSVKS